MASYEYPKAMEINLPSPGQPYQTSQFPNNSPQKHESDYPKSPEKFPQEDKKEDLPSKKRRVFSCFSFKYWQPFFNLSSKEFGKRIMIALFPCTGSSFFTQIKGNPDLYGPFWIYASLIFCLAASGNVYTYLLNPSNSNYTYNFSYIPAACLIVYIYGFTAPYLMHFLLRLFEVEREVEKSYIECLCIYGYSTFVFLPMSLLCMIPLSAIQWLFMGIAAMDSTAFLVLNFWRELKILRNNNKWVIMFLLISGQITLYILFEVFFFSAVYKVTSSSAASTTTTTSTATKTTTAAASTAAGTVASTVASKLQILVEKSGMLQKMMGNYRCSIDF